MPPSLEQRGEDVREGRDVRIGGEDLLSAARTDRGEEEGQRILYVFSIYNGAIIMARAWSSVSHSSRPSNSSQSPANT